MVLSILAVFGVFRRRVLLLGFLGLCYVAQVAKIILRPDSNPSAPTGTIAVTCFIAGLAAYRYRDRIIWSRGLFWAMLVLAFIINMLPHGLRFSVVPVTYVTMYLGLTSPRRNATILSGDYSYALYLYGFPIQQAYIAAHPMFREWYWNLAASVPTAILLAICSWWLVEKPVLNRRQVLKKLEGWYLSFPLVQRLRSWPASVGRSFRWDAAA